MRHLFDRPLGAFIAPHGSLFKYAYDPSSIIAAGINFAGQMATNQVNAEMHADDLATYLHTLGKQREWQKEDQQWSKDYTDWVMDKQNVYNSPLSQMERYNKAGLNPYLLMSQGAVGNGNSQSFPQPNPGSRASVSPFQRPGIENPLSSVADKIFGASSVKSQRIGALAEFSKALPDLVKSVGKDGAKRIAESFLGSQLDMNRIDSMIQNEAVMQSYSTKIRAVESEIYSLYKKDEAANIIALQEQQFNKLSSDIGLNASQGKLNDAKIKELASEYVRNIADAFKLHKEGDMFVASAAQYSAMSNLIGLQSTRLKFENKSNGYVDGAPLWDFLGTKQHTKSIIGRYKNQDYLNGDAIGFWVDRFFNDYVKILGSAAPHGGSSVTTTGYVNP